MKSKLSKEKLRQSFLFALIALLSFSAVAQEITVKGVIKSAEDDFPIPGVTVLVKGTSAGAVTDFDGNYAIEANIGDILVVEYIGMEKIEVPVSKEIQDIVMQAESKVLDEVVVIGYGKVKKKELTGAVAQVKAEAIQDNVVADLGAALQGQVTGVTVTNSGELGEPSDIFIRGVSSLFGSNSPLYVVDGIPQADNPNLAPNEIETIDVLKDAASAAVYGARGSNGVVIITTKRGKAGPMKVSLTATSGIRKVTSDLDFLNSKETFLAASLGQDPGTAAIPKGQDAFFNDTNLLDFVLNDNAPTNTYQASISGGSEKFTYSVVGGYFNAEGSVINTSFDRFNGRLNTAYTGDKLTIRTGFGFILEERERSNSNLFSRGLAYSPLLPEIDGNTNTFVTTDDIQADESASQGESLSAINDIRKGRRDRFNGNLSLGYDLSQSLNFKTNLGFIVTNRRERLKRKSTELFNIDTQELEVDNVDTSFLNQAIGRDTELTWDGSLTYNKSFGKNNFTLLGVVSLEERKFESFTTRAFGLKSNDVDSFLAVSQDNVITLPGFSSSNNLRADARANRTERIFGTLARLQYNYDGKYLFSALVRRDGSSKFGRNNRFGYFPSVSVGWNVSDEAFWDKISFGGAINSFKLRASWGTTGNDRIAANQTESTAIFGADFVSNVNGSDQLNNGEFVRFISNPDLKWETTVQTNIGADLSLFKNAVTLSADYYVSDKEDLLFTTIIPASAGVSAVAPLRDNRLSQNIGDMRNEGFEIALGYKQRKTKFKWSANATYTQNRNEVLSTPKDSNGNPVSIRLNNQSISGNGDNRGLADSNVSFFREGFEAGAFFLYKTDGVINTPEELAEYRAGFTGGRDVGGTRNPQLGDLKFVDANGDGTIDADDRVYSGSALPDFELGLNLNFAYSNFDLSMQWYGAIGGEVYNGVEATSFFRGRSRELLNQFDELRNPNSEVPKVNELVDRTDPNVYGNTDRYLEDGTFVRLKNIQLGYSLPKSFTENVGIRNLKIFLSASNVLTFTKYSGFDPEIGGGSTEILDGESVSFKSKGVDTGRNPLTSLYSVGLKLDF